MSIQSIANFTVISKIKSGVDILQQAASREFRCESPKIFFRYRTRYTHPTFDRFLTHPPVAWSNYHRAEAAHWINYPAFITKLPFLLECNDHPLSSVSYHMRGLHEPWEIISRIEQAAEIYALPQCKRIAVSSEGYVGLFEYYFGSRFNEKLILLHVPGCLPRDIQISQDCRAKFVCLASDYHLKGVDLLIEAWLSIENRCDARLVIACPNVPGEMIKRAGSAITFILKAPLSTQEKHRLLEWGNVSLGPQHVNGGGNIWEGMEYGHAVIFFANHSTYFQTIGTEITVPYYFYSPRQYGIEWKTFAQFKETLLDHKRRGLFDVTIEQLAVALKRYIGYPNILYRDRAKAFTAANGVASLEARNCRLRQIYSDILL